MASEEAAAFGAGVSYPSFPWQLGVFPKDGFTSLKNRFNYGTQNLQNIKAEF